MSAKKNRKIARTIALILLAIGVVGLSFVVKVPWQSYALVAIFAFVYLAGKIEGEETILQRWDETDGEEHP